MKTSFQVCLLISFSLLRIETEAQINGGGTLPLGYKFIEGDILVAEVSPNPLALTVFTATQLWPGGRVPYEFNGNVSAGNRSAMLDAMAEWQSVANIQFVPRSNEGAYVHIQSRNGNNSEVGRQGGRQLINIFNWDNKWIMAHELAHTLGFWHEQSRSDRNDYISINLANVDPTNWHNFSIHSEANHYGLYDFDSVMHYGAHDFSTNNQPVITVRPPYNSQWQWSDIGQRDHLSVLDKQVMSFLYPPANWRFVDTGFAGSPQTGSFLNPFIRLADGEADVPGGGTVWIQPGTYAAIGTHSKPMTLQAPLGGVALKN